MTKISEETKALLKPFPKESIKKRPGSGRMQLSYISQGDCNMRLLEVWDNDWMFEVLEHYNIGSEVVVKCQLTSPAGRIRQNYGSAVKKGNQEIGDVFKTAASDGLKKCASMFGVALHLYGVKV